MKRAFPPCLACDLSLASLRSACPQVLFFAFTNAPASSLTSTSTLTPTWHSPETFKAYDIDYGSSRNLAWFPWYGRMLLGIYLNPNIAMPNITTQVTFHLCTITMTSPPLPTPSVSHFDVTEGLLDPTAPPSHRNVRRRDSVPNPPSISCFNMREGLCEPYHPFLV